jgi:hypothetical protein
MKNGSSKSVSFRMAKPTRTNLTNRVSSIVLFFDQVAGPGMVSTAPTVGAHDVQPPLGAQLGAQPGSHGAGHAG